MHSDRTMTPEETIRACIDTQIAFNSGKNLYYEGAEGGPAFTPMSRRMITEGAAVKSIIGETRREEIIDYTVERALREFYAANQYIDPGADHIERLRMVYRRLLAEVAAGRWSAERIARRHYRRLGDWLADASPAARRLSDPDSPTVEYVVCAEYSAELQLAILGIDLETLREPVMDVGCGEHAHLVTYLRSRGVAAYGIDRICDPASPFLTRRNWFEFDFGCGRWGTLISNLSFSSHFINNHLRADGEHAAYAGRYMELLDALMPGGSYHYAPSLGFIERYLPADRYSLARERFAGEHSRTIVTRIS